MTWSVLTSIASVLVSLTTLAALAVVATFSVYAAGAMEVLASSGGTSPSTTRPASTSSRPGPSPARYDGWLPLYCGSSRGGFRSILPRDLRAEPRGSLAFWLRRARKIDVDAALIAGGLRLGVRDLLRGPGTHRLVFLPCARCVCASCAE